MFALTLQGGTCMSTPPDVCKTPAPPGAPVPIPYVNIFQCNIPWRFLTRGLRFKNILGAAAEDGGGQGDNSQTLSHNTSYPD